MGFTFNTDCSCRCRIMIIVLNKLYQYNTWGEGKQVAFLWGFSISFTKQPMKMRRFAVHFTGFTVDISSADV